MNEPKISKAGKLLCVDSGVYSSYSVHGFFVVLRDFDPHAELAEYLDVNPKQRVIYSFDEHRFLAALLSKGLLMEVEYGTLYLSDYSCHEEVKFMPSADA